MTINNLHGQELKLPDRFNSAVFHASERLRYVPEVYRGPVQALLKNIDSALQYDGLSILGMAAQSAYVEERAGEFSLDAHKDISLFYHAVAAYGFALAFAFEGDDKAAETMVNDGRNEMQAAIAAGLASRK